jgi:iron complex outermembrane receptor protein
MHVNHAVGSTMRLSHRLIVLAIAAALAAPAVADEADEADERSRALPAVVVTATRTEQSSFDVPAAIDAITIDSADNDGLGVNVSEVLSLVPGVLARYRLNYAQDEQISIRGFGARATFGVRGVRLYTDGLPASMPDGAGQVSHFNLDSAERIEVLRGPFSALYGNSSGGVIQVFTADGSDPLEMRAGVVSGHPFTATIAGNSISALIPLSFLPTTGFAPQHYGWNIWPRNGLGNNNQISDFAPNNSLISTAPEPAAWALMIAGFGLAGGVLRRRRTGAARA